MRILWMSDSPTSPSGFGNVTRFVCAGLAQQGHQVSILGWQARGSPETWQGCTLYPMGRDNFGADVLSSYLYRTLPEVLVTLADVWWLTYISDPAIAGFMRTAGIVWALYYPIDGDMGGGQLPAGWVRVLETVDLPIAMSQYGRDVTQANGVEPAYIPHGVDAQLFRPAADKAAAKRALGYERRFVILSDARNQPRKLLPRTLEIFRRFARDKDDVVLHLHCDPNDPAARSPGYCYDLRSDIEFLGLADKVRTTAGMSIATGLPLSELAAIYQAADVHLLSSWGEGFGLPTLQAAAAGVVPMASDYTASRELVSGHGEAIRVRHFVPDHFGLQRALIDVDDAASKLERLYRDPATLEAKSQAARRFGEGYDWARIVPQWDDLLRSEVPRLRVRRRSRGTVSRVTLGPQGADGPAELTKVVRGAFPGLPEGAQVTIAVAESQIGQLTAEVLRDASESRGGLTLPVTLPPADPELVRERISGCVYVASAEDLPVLGSLHGIFPGLRVWSSRVLDLEPRPGNGRPVKTSSVPLGSDEYRRHLAASTLALDLGGVDAGLPRQAAALRVPCIGLADQPDQALLWPRLSLAAPDAARAARLGRWLLTDQGEASSVCALAQSLLAGEAVPAVTMGDR